MESTRTEIDLETLLSRAEWVRRLARRLVVDEARADELVAEVWHAALGAHGPRGSLEGWVRSVLNNAARTLRRGDRNRRDRERSAARSEAVPSSAAILERSELQHAIARELQRLPAIYRDVLILRYWEDLPPRAIATRLALPVATVRTRLARALEQLRARLDAEHGERRAWCLSLVPLAVRGGGPFLPTVLVLGLVTCLLGLVAGFAALRAVARGSSFTSPEGEGISLVATSATRSEEARAPARGEGEAPALAVPAGGARVSLPVVGAQAAASTGTLDVRVVSRMTGLPIPSAEVRVESREARKNDAPALFTFEGLEVDPGGTLQLAVPTDLRLFVQALGHKGEGGSDSVVIEPLASGELRPLLLELPTGLDIVFFGRALGVDGLPLEEQSVQLLTGTTWTWDDEVPLACAPPERHPVERRTITDAGGRFSFRAASWRRPMVWLETADGASVLVEVGPGFEQPERAMDVRVKAPAKLLCRVVDAADRPVADVGVELWTDTHRWLHPQQAIWPGPMEEPDLGRRGTAGPEGSLLEGLPSGVPFELVVTRGGAPLDRRREHLTLMAGEVRELTLVLEGRATIAGLAIDSAGLPVTELDLWLVDPPGYLVYGLDKGETPFATTRTDGAGRFAFRGIAPGRWWLGPAPRSEERPPEAWAVSSIEEVEVLPEDRHVEVRLLVERGRYLRGHVVDPEGEPVPRAPLVANSGSRDCFGTADDTGSFELGPVEPGAWHVQAYGPRDSLFAEGEAVEALAGGDPVLVCVVLGGRLRGRVVRGAGGPPTQAAVRIAQADSKDWWEAANEGSGGVFERSGLPSGTYNIFAFTADGCFGELRGVALAPGEVRDDLAVHVLPAATLRLRSTGAEHGTGWRVLRGGEALQLGFARPAASTAVPPGPLVLEHWPLGLVPGDHGRIELDVALGEQREVLLP